MDLEKMLSSIADFLEKIPKWMAALIICFGMIGYVLYESLQISQSNKSNNASSMGQYIDEQNQISLHEVRISSLESNYFDLEQDVEAQGAEITTLEKQVHHLESICELKQKKHY